MFVECLSPAFQKSKDSSILNHIRTLLKTVGMPFMEIMYYIKSKYIVIISNVKLLIRFVKRYLFKIKMFYLNSTLTFGISTVLVFQLKVYYKVDRLLTKVLQKERYFVSEIFTLLFNMERVLLQPANSLLQPAKKVRI